MYLVLALEEETAVQAKVGTIVWAFGRLKKPRIREMSARGYALHSVCPQLPFIFVFSKTINTGIFSSEKIFEIHAAI